MFRKKLPATRCPLHALLLIVLCSPFIVNCSFDYGELEPTIDNSIPDLVMENVEYVRVRSSQPQAKFLADRAERYEELNIMKLENISFEQFGNDIDEVNALGTAGSATVEIDTGNIVMQDVVRIEVESEDITIETEALEWLDEPRTLASGEHEEVTIYMGNGGSFIGIGLHADALNHTWQFLGFVMGDYIFEDDASNDEEEGTEGINGTDEIYIDYISSEEEIEEIEESEEGNYASLLRDKVDMFNQEEEKENGRDRN